LSLTLSIAAIDRTSPLLSAVIKLGRKHSGTLGFFPDGAFEDHAARGHLLAASVGEGDLAGYCAFRVSKGRVMVAHLCVAEAYRGTGVAKELFASVKAHAQKRDLRGIGLHCRRDYPAYGMWPKLGFAAIGSKPGRGADGKELTFWWHDLHAEDLFSPFEEADGRLRVVLDCNIFRDLHDSSETRNKEAKYLPADWLAGQIELCIVKELYNELDRLVLPVPREPLRLKAHLYRCLDHDELRAGSIYEELKVIFGHPKPTPRQASDLCHVAMSAAADAEVFITRDNEVLGHAAEIGKRYGLQVLRPVDLISRFNETEQAALYQPARFASTDIQKARPRPMDLDKLAEKLHAPSQRETRVQFTAKLAALLCDVLRCSRSALAATALRHALLQITADTAKLGRKRIVIRELRLSEEVLSILHELGFRMGTEGLEKYTLRFLGDTSAFEQVLKGTGMPAVPSGATGPEIEAQFWPAKVLGAGVDTWAVAIQAGWATELFETTFADQLLVRPKRELILSRENVYYSAAVQSGMEGATGRLLWYVSKDAQQAGSQSIRACSRLLEVRRGPAKVLFNEYRRLGVFEWRDILAMAGGDPTKEIIALRFADTELFEQSFPGAQAKALGIRNNFTSPVKIPETAFAEIYRHGMKLPVRPLTNTHAQPDQN
jgi:GNAT superfamily N-acetyltransferase